MDIVFVSMENWDEIWRRNQFICAEYTRRFPSSKILFVGLSRDVSNRIRRGQLSGLLDDDTQEVPGYPRITFTRPLKLFPNTLPAGRAINDAMARRHIKKHMDRLGIKSPLLWLNPHSAVHMVGKLQERSVIYDITDDWTSLTQSEKVRQVVVDQDRRLCQCADAVIVCSERLYQMKQSVAQKLHLIPNGVDAEHYRCVLDDHGQLPPECHGWMHPVLGYTGTIHRDRVDVALIEATASLMKEGSIGLIGPCHLSDEEIARLTATGRVFITGQMPYAIVPQLMRAFDVSITPHVVSEFTESLNPIKLWEYLAGGKPIVSTNVAGFRDYPQFVTIAQGPDQFLKAALASLQEPATIAIARREEARKHSWSGRLDTILEAVSDAEQHRSKPN